MIASIKNNRWLYCWGLATAIFVSMILTLGAEKCFAFWGIKATHPEFLDARGVTSGLESYALGKDPLVENPRDPLGRPLNYPRVWLELARFGINQSHTVLMGYLMMALFFVSMWVFPSKDLDWLGCGLLILAAFSPAVLLGMERANVDLLMFFLLALGVTGMAGTSLLRKWLGVTSILLGFILKLYPMFAFAVLFGEPKGRFCKWLGWITAIMALYIFGIWEDLKLIHSATPRSTGLSYGMNVLWMELSEHGEFYGRIAKILAWTGVGIALGLMLVGFTHGSKFMLKIQVPAKTLAAFRTGAGVYGGTFLLGNNWDYRLIFLILTLPLLARVWQSNSSALRIVAFGVVATTLISLWSISIYQVMAHLPLGSEACVLLDEFSNWCVFLGIAFLFGSSLPRWIQSGPKTDDIVIDH